jgi:hypothetical protein
VEDGNGRPLARSSSGVQSGQMSALVGTVGAEKGGLQGRGVGISEVRWQIASHGAGQKVSLKMFPLLSLATPLTPITCPGVGS